jgi:8-amino-7-oxononanoate synthase
MGLIQRRTAQYILPQLAKREGIYPFYRIIESDQAAEAVINGKKVLMFGSNNYLGLANHPLVKEAAKNAVDKYGTGCSGSRILNGTLDIHIELEEKLARLVGKESALCFSTGFQVNLGLLSALAGRQDTIILDEYDHASIIEGARLSFATARKYLHNSMASLEEKLLQGNAKQLSLIVVDGIFSMDGDIADLPGIIRLAEKYSAAVMVDDAHALGVLGPRGEGSSCHFGVTDKVDLIMGTFSKSFASVGGFVACDEDTINYLKHHARSLLFSAAMTPASTATVLAAIDLMLKEPDRIRRLWDISRYALEGLKSLGFDTGKAETPIIPLYIGDETKTMQLTRMLLDGGVFVNPVLSPAVAREHSLIRFTLMADHTRAHVDLALDKLHSCARKLCIVREGRG